MPIYKKVREDLKRYTFIKDVGFANSTVYLTYDVDGKEKTKKIAYRANSEQLIALIEKIKRETGYYWKKEERDIKVKKELAKPMMFTTAGDDDE